MQHLNLIERLREAVSGRLHERNEAFPCYKILYRYAPFLSQCDCPVSTSGSLPERCPAGPMRRKQPLEAWGFVCRLQTQNQGETHRHSTKLRSHLPDLG